MSFPRWPPFPLGECLGLLPGKGLGRLQGFPQRPSPFAMTPPVTETPRPFPSWASSSLGIYRPLVMGNSRSHLSCAFVASGLPRRSPAASTLQSLLHRRRTLPLSRPRPPFEVLRRWSPLLSNQFGAQLVVSTARRKEPYSRAGSLSKGRAVSPQHDAAPIVGSFQQATVRTALRKKLFPNHPQHVDAGGVALARVALRAPCATRC
jgi:hypothetical protein